MNRIGGMARTVVLLVGCALAAGWLAGCAAATSSETRSERTEEQIATRAGTGGGRGGNEGPLGETRALHGTIDPATGRRTAEPAVDRKLREPRRSEILTGRVRQAAEEYEPGSGELVYGYRVQVLAAPDFQTAAGEATRLKELLDGAVPVYVEFIDPYYKLRVGDFTSQPAAQPLLARIRALGYADAWTVRTTIKHGEP